MLKLVLQSIDPEAACKAVRADTTEMLDSELGAKLTSANGGRLVTAPAFITQRLVDVMDMFCIATQPCRTCYSFYTAQLKTPEHSSQQGLAMAAGAWELELFNIIQASFEQHSNLEKIGAGDGTERSTQNVKELGLYVCQLLTERIMRLLPNCLDYPGCTVVVLSPQTERARAGKFKLLRDMVAIIAVEEAARVGGVVEASWILNDICWRHNPVVRLFWHTMARERVDGIGPETRHIAESMHIRLPHEKPPEDVHQFIRDRSRGQRHKHLTVNSVYDAQIHSGLLRRMQAGGRLPCHKRMWRTKP